MPGAGGVWPAGLAWAAGAALVAFAAGASGAGAAGTGGAAVVAAGLTGAETVTSGAIFVTVAAGTPALARSSTVEYGRPSTIFLAVALPTAGRASSSASLAVLRSNFLAAGWLFFLLARSRAKAAGAPARPARAT